MNLQYERKGSFWKGVGRATFGINQQVGKPGRVMTVLPDAGLDGKELWGVSLGSGPGLSGNLML